MALTQIEPYSFDSSNSYSVSNLTVTGNISVSGNIVGNVYGNQANITGIGTLANLTVTGPTTLQLASDILTNIANATGTVTHDLTSGGVFFHSTPSANFTANFTNVPVTNNRVLTATLLINQGATAYVANSVQVEGVPQGIKWLNSSAPTGASNKVDVLSFNLIRASNSWTIIGCLSSYS